MRTRNKVLTGAATAALVLGGVGAAAASGGDDDGAERSITGDALQKASDAALAHTGEGKVTDTEVGDEEGYYEVEVRLDDGSETDVHLDEDFNVHRHRGRRRRRRRLGRRLRPADPGRVSGAGSPSARMGPCLKESAQPARTSA